MSQIYRVTQHPEADYQPYPFVSYVCSDSPEHAAEEFAIDLAEGEDLDMTVSVTQRWLDSDTVGRTWLITMRVKNQPVACVVSSTEVIG